jgi:hypothetical protein
MSYVNLNVAEYGFYVGQDVGILEHLGATKEQTDNYVEFRYVPVSVHQRALYLVQVELGALSYSLVLSDHERVDNLRLAIAQNWSCLQPNWSPAHS